MKLLTSMLMILAIVILCMSIVEYRKLRKHLNQTLYCSDFRVGVISNVYVGLLLFFILAYVVFTVFWIRLSEYPPVLYLVFLLLFFGSLFVGVSTLFLRDYTRSVLELKLNQTDTMTGLMTKCGLEVAAKKLLESPSGNSVFCILDLDRFKQINDIFGHSRGDEVIQMVAEILRKAVRTNDLVARFGGDEYVIIFRHIRIEQAQRIMHRIERTVLSALKEHDCSVCTGISYGMTEMKGGTSQNYQVIFDQADRALYEMKQRKKTAL